MAQRHHHVGRGDQVFSGQIERAVLNQATAGANFGHAKFGLDGGEFVTDDDGHTFRAGQDVQQVINLAHDLFVFRHDLVLLQASQALQTHLQNFLRLRF